VQDHLETHLDSGVARYRAPEIDANLPDAVPRDTIVSARELTR